MKRILVLIAAALLVALGPGQSPTPPPAATLNCAVMRERTHLFLQNHFAFREFTDELSTRTYRKYFDMLDSGKNVFLAADLAEFKTYEHDLNARLERLDCTFVEVTEERFLKRYREALATIVDLLKTPFDYSKEEFLETDRKKLAWAASSTELRERWRKILKSSAIALLDTDPDLKPQEIADRLTKRFKLAEKGAEDSTSDDVNATYLNAFALSLDPHSAYMLPAAKDSYNATVGLHLEGIGANLSQNDGYIIVEALIPGGAAARDGRLKKGDKIVVVDPGTGVGPQDVVDLRFDKVLQLIRGKKGTKVKLTLLRKDEAGAVGRLTLELVRDTVRMADSEAHGDVLTLGGKRVGVLNLPGFYVDHVASQAGDSDYRSSAVDTARELARLLSQNVEGLVLDLRQNGGGDIVECARIISLFLDQRPVAQTADRDGRLLFLEQVVPSVLYRGPVVVLTSKQSASASEIFAGALQDFGRAVVVGNSRTYGKGTVQHFIDLPGTAGRESDGSILVTVYKFFLPSGRSTQERGVPADVVVPNLLEPSPWGEATNDSVLPYSAMAPGRPFTPLRSLAPQLDELRRRSAARIKASTAYGELQKRIDEAVKRMNDTLLPLKWTKKPASSLAPAPVAVPAVPAANLVVRPDDIELFEAAAILLDHAELSAAAR